jgi:predicted DCC family thiol-disulfide oxidoreductase YuxK
VDTEALDTVYVVINHDEGSESLLSRSEAALYVLNQLGGFWGFSTRWFRWLPRPVRELAYRVVARHRYRIFGKFDSCPLPWPDVRQRFVDR